MYSPHIPLDTFRQPRTAYFPPVFSNIQTGNHQIDMSNYNIPPAPIHVNRQIPPLQIPPLIVQQQRMEQIIEPSIDNSLFNFAQRNSNRSQIINDLIEKYSTESKMHMYSASYYSIFYYLYLIPSSILIAAASIISFLISSEQFDEKTVKWMAISVGIIGIVIAFMYTLLNGLYIQTKKEAFKLSHNDYEDVLTNLRFYLYDNTNISVVLQKIEKKILKIKNRNKYYIPVIIYRIYGN